mmetsp:Transcript_16336/g.46490  ORF Transcript_16336/g.46490 Transcript_16336/m.46490 type:complete len:410 (+) Transcript_16336:471-1700(+)
MRDEDVHAGPEDVDLLEDGTAHRVRGRHDGSQGVLLRPQRHDEEGAVLGPLLPQGVESALPSGMAELPAAEAAPRAVARSPPPIPTVLGGVAGDDGAHAHEDHATAGALGTPHQVGDVDVLGPVVAGLVDVEPVRRSAFSAGTIEQGADEVKANGGRAVGLRELAAHRLLELLARRDQRHATERQDVHVADGAACGRLIQVEPIGCAEAGDGRMAGLEVGGPLGDAFPRQPEHLHEARLRRLHGPGASDREEGDALESEEPSAIGGLRAEDGIVHDALRADLAEPTKQPGELKLHLYMPQHRPKLHEADSKQAVLLGEGEERAEGVGTAPVEELPLHFDIRMKPGARVLDGLAHLLAAQVVDHMPRGHQRPRYRKGWVDVAGGHRENEREHFADKLRLRTVAVCRKRHA